MTTSRVIVVSVLTGLLTGALGVYLLPAANTRSDTTSEGEKKPLYWVAPMDDSYRRDKPGKSPMGMDLVPVFEETGAASDAAGTVTISPAVENNLGVRTAAITKGSLNTEVHTVGYIQYDEDSLIHIHPRVEGWVETLHLKASGEPVEKGQPLYTLYSPQLVNAQEEYIIALRRNDQALISAARDRLSALQLPESQINAVASSRQVKQNVTFYAPQSGVVDVLQIREGFYVKPGTTVMSIGKLDEVWVEAEVFERDASLIQQGQKVTMTLDYLPGKTWQGKVDYVYPALNSQTRTLRVRLKFANTDNLLKPNMFANVTLYAEADEPTLNVPLSAVIRTGKQSRVVLALGDGKFRSVEVETGLTDGEQIAVVSGLTMDDRVVTSAQFLIDSESSKTSDFQRMTATDAPLSVWTEAQVKSAMPEHRMVTLTHAPVPEWDWPEMTMDFTVAGSVDMQAMANAQRLHAEITKKADNDFAITAIHIMTTKSASSDNTSQATVDGTINQLNRSTRIANISRGPIEKWNRPATTMDFVLADNIDMSLLAVGDAITFTFEAGERFTIIDVQPANSNEHHAMPHDGGVE